MSQVAESAAGGAPASDPTGGAGIQADLLTLASMGSVNRSAWMPAPQASRPTC